MFKAAILAVLGFVAASAHSVMEIPLKNFVDASPKESLVQMQLYGSKLQASASSVTWGVCDSQKIYDVASGTASPNPPVVGKNVGLNLDILFNADADVRGLYVFVALTPKGGSSPTPLYQEDFPAHDARVYSAGEEFTDSISWLIPAFAPLGHYKVTITVHGASKDANKYACLTADFDI